MFKADDYYLILSVAYLNVIWTSNVIKYKTNMKIFHIILMNIKKYSPGVDNN